MAIATERLSSQQAVAEYFKKLGIAPVVRPDGDNDGKQQKSISLGYAVLGSTLPPREFGGVIKEQKNNGNNGQH